jgi:hypothetical protein
VQVCAATQPAAGSNLDLKSADHKWRGVDAAGHHRPYQGLDYGMWRVYEMGISCACWRSNPAGPKCSLGED